MATTTSPQVEKALIDVDDLPSEISDLLNRTKRLASTSPAAMDTLQDLLPPLYTRVASASGKSDALQPGLEPSAKTLAGISYLQRVLDRHDYGKVDDRILMIDRVGLNKSTECTVAGFESAELLGQRLNDDRILEMHGGDDEDGIVGKQIEVYSVRDDYWRSAFVAEVCNHEYLLMFFDGKMERVSLAKKAWRLVA